MGYKPFLTNASLTDVQSLLRGLEFPTMDGFPILAIDGEGFTFEDGVATLKAVQDVEILAHIEDDLIHVDHTTLRKYALRGDGTHKIAQTATPIAVGDGIDCFAGDMAFVMCLRQINNTAEEGVLLTLIDSVTGNKLVEFGYKYFNVLYLKANNVEQFTEGFEGVSFNYQWPMIVGWCQDSAIDLTYFFCNGQVMPTQSNTGKLPVLGTNPCHLRVGDALQGEIYWAGIERALVNIHTDTPSVNYVLTKDATATWVTI